MQKEFPGIVGFSRVNIFRMKRFYQTYSIVSQAVTQIQVLPIFNIPWGHNVVLLIKVKDNEERLWYAQKTIENGWSRSILEHWIESDLYHRDGKAITNFINTLPKPQSDLAQQSLKDPYIVDFLGIDKIHRERELEQGMIDNIEEVLLELGKGFALVARQFQLQVDDQNFYIDLLFYHIVLKCYVVVELKAREFDPGDTGQINFYLAAVDDLIKGPDDNRTIGLILCKSKNNLVAKYSLASVSSPIGISAYETEMKAKMSKKFKSALPTVEEIEAEFEKHEALREKEKEEKA